MIWEMLALICAFGLGVCASPFVMIICMPLACQYAAGQLAEARSLSRSAKEEYESAEIDLDKALKMRQEAAISLNEAQALRDQSLVACKEAVAHCDATLKRLDPTR